MFARKIQPSVNKAQNSEYQFNYDKKEKEQFKADQNTSQSASHHKKSKLQKQTYVRTQQRASEVYNQNEQQNEISQQNFSWQDRFIQNSQLKENMSKEFQEFLSIRKKLENNEEISLLEYTQILKNKYVLESGNLTIIIINSFLKKLYNNEGIDEEKDDIFRRIYTEQRAKISDILRSRPEVKNVLRLSFEQLNQLPLDKIAGLTTFIVKGGLKITQEQLRQICRTCKVKLLEEKGSRASMISMSILLKQFTKYHQENVKEKNQTEILIDFFKFCKEITEKFNQEMDIPESALATRALHYFNLCSSKLVCQIIKTHKSKLQKSMNMQLYSFLDILLETIIIRNKDGTISFSTQDQANVEGLDFLFTEFNRRLIEPERFNLQNYEVASYAKIVSNKKQILPIDQIPGLSEMLKLLVRYVETRGQETLTTPEMIQIYNCLLRYEIQVNDKLKEVFADRIENYLKDTSKLRLSSFELMKALILANFSKDKLNNQSISKLFRMYVDKFKYEFENNKSDFEKVIVFKNMVSFLQKTKQENIKLDYEILAELKSYKDKHFEKFLELKATNRNIKGIANEDS